MVYNATREIEKAFQADNLKYRVGEAGELSYLEAGANGKNVSSVKVRFISTDNDNDVAVRITSFMRAPENKRGAVLEAFNTLQRKFRYVKFTIDEDGDIHIAFDMPSRTLNVGPIAVEMFIRMVKIADESYPVLMKAIWS